METSNELTIETNATSTDNVFSSAAAGTRNVNWLDMSYVGFIIAAGTALVACLFI